VLSASQQLFLPPAAPVLPVQEPTAHRTRSRAPAPLALFASGGQLHECLQYCILMAKLSCASSVTMGFAGLCAIHHMSTLILPTLPVCALLSCTKTTRWPCQFLTLQPVICWSIASSNATPGIRQHGIPRTPMSLAISAKALAQGRPPTPNVLPIPTHYFASTTTTSLRTRGRKYAIPWWFVKSDQRRMTLTPHKSPLVATASATLAMWVPTQHPWNSSSFSLTVSSCKKMHALAPLTLRTSTLTHPCPSGKTFASKSWIFHKSSLTNTS
jgi:hypothetical protein